MDKIGILLLVSAATSNAVANSFLKVAFAGNMNMFSDGIMKGVLKVAMNPYAVIGAIFFGVSFLFFGSALSRVNLYMAYPLMSGLALVLIFGVSVLFFKEAVNIWGVLGVFCILIGIILLNIKA